jgi:coenzyme F420-0:L-glutamate ligase/coenzyme F420-1:gamma-L-glutamate ligase
MTPTLQLTALPGIPLIQPGDDLGTILLQALARAGIQLLDGDILVIAQKIISKAEGRRVNLEQVVPTARAIELAGKVEKDPRIVELILRESKQVLRTRPGVMIVEHRLGFICASAGIDHSNVEGVDDCPGTWVLLLPQDPDASAQVLRDRLETASRSRLGVLIIDSHGRAWRMGTTGAAIGLAGMPGLVDLRGKSDLFNYELQITQVGAADELASAASLLMGQAAEGTPAVHIRGFPYPLREGNMGELLRPADQDLFR